MYVRNTSQKKCAFNQKNSTQRKDNTEMGDEIEMIFDYIDKSKSIRVVILTGEGDIFCAGATLDTNKIDMLGDIEHLNQRDQLQNVASIYRCKKPVIAAINGHSIGIGITMALQCDIRIIAEDAKVSFP